jgi:hypothetical protein
MHSEAGGAEAGLQNGRGGVDSRQGCKNAAVVAAEELKAMGQSIPFGTHIARPPIAARAGETGAVKVESVPWTIWCMVAGIVSGTIGGPWDISWHMSIGRDTFWTPAHIMIQMTGVLVGIACAYMILTATFGHDTATQNASVKIWGFRGPLGAFIAVWGCMAMLTSAPFDNWWHNAYGLDVKIVSPPHTLLSLGSLAIKIGLMALMAGLMSRATEGVRRTLTWLLLYIGASCVSQIGTILTTNTWPSAMHTAACYLAVAIGIPAVLIAPAWASQWRWGCTAVAGIYTAILLAFEWILPLFPATPKLGPVYQHITHLIPLHLPLLLIVPAIVMDVLWRKTSAWGRWKLALATGPLFVLSFMAVQWPFADFLMSPAARNRIFGMAYFAYFDPATILYDPYKFAGGETGAQFAKLILMALVFSVFTARLGFAWGDWMRRMRR